MYAGSFADMTRAAFYRATMWYRAAIVASALACGLLSELNAQAIKAAELPPAQREAIEGIIHDYVLKNPDVLIEALQNAQDKLNHEADAKATKVLSERASEIFDDPATLFRVPVCFLAARTASASICRNCIAKNEAHQWLRHDGSAVRERPRD